MKLEEANAIAKELIMGSGMLANHFRQWLICGSIRRKKPFVNDIDIVAIPKLESEYKFGEPSLGQRIVLLDPTGYAEATKLGKRQASRFLDGGYIKRFQYKGIMVDVYLTNQETFSTLCLIRTGSTQHNISLTTLARGKGMKLFADGTGLCRINPDDEIINIVAATEDEILMNLLGRIPAPEERER